MRLDDVGHGVQAHHVGGAEGAATWRGPASCRSGRRPRRSDRPNFSASWMVASMPKMPTRLAMKLGVSLARTTPLPSVVVRKALELVEDLGLRGRRRDQLDQMHVARRVEEMDAAEARLDRLGQHLGQLGDRQARGVARRRSRAAR